MNKLSQFAVSISAAMVCAAVPASFKSSPANTTLFSLNTAEARVGRPLTATSVAGVSRRVQRREYRRTAAGVAAGAAVGAAAVGAPRLELPLPPRPSRSDLPDQPLLSVRAMATVQGRTRML